MATTHSDKALKTLELLGTSGQDWFHPAVEWKQELVPVVGRVICPDCGGDRKAFYAVEESKLPYESQDNVFKSTAPASFVWPHVDIVFTYTHGATTELKDGFYYRNSLQADARRQYAAQYGVVEQDCRRCYRFAKRMWSGREHGRAFQASHGTVLAIVKQLMWVGYIQWPAGTDHGVSRFGYGGNSRHQCELCGKGINKSGRVPLVTEKDGKPRGMWVGQDCASKFTGVVALKPTVDKKAKKLDHVLAENVESVEPK